MSRVALVCAVGGGDGEQYGRVVGQTAFYSASVDGTLKYPINHWINYHRPKDQLNKLFYGKNNEAVDVIDTKGNLITNVQTGLGQFGTEADTQPSSSVYSKTVDGTDVVNLKINRLKDKRK